MAGDIEQIRSVSALQDLAETVSRFAVALARYGAIERAKEYAAKADELWKRWIEAKQKARKECQF